MAYENSYSWRGTITINHDVGGHLSTADLTDFPVLISGTYAELAHTTHGGYATDLNGYDIVFFTASDGSGTKLSHEIESYNHETGAIVAWVKIPTYDADADTVIYVFAGNASVSTSQQNETGTWNAGFAGVWHVPNGTTLTLLDSTSNNNDGGIGGGDGTGITAATGKIGGGAAFNTGLYVRITVGSGASLQVSVFTYELWVNSAVGRSLIGGSYANSSPKLDMAANGQLIFDKQSIIRIGASTSNTPLSEWAHVAVTYDASGNYAFYINGVASGSGTNLQTFSFASMWFGNAGNWGNYVGSMDEVRVSSVARSANWIHTEYSNQSNPGTFYSLGSWAEAVSNDTLAVNDTLDLSDGVDTSIQTPNFFVPVTDSLANYQDAIILNVEVTSILVSDDLNNFQDTAILGSTSAIGVADDLNNLNDAISLVTLVTNLNISDSLNNYQDAVTLALAIISLSIADDLNNYSDDIVLDITNLSKARISQIVREVLEQPSTQKACVSQIVREVLISVIQDISILVADDLSLSDVILLLQTYGVALVDSLDNYQDAIEQSFDILTASVSDQLVLTDAINTLTDEIVALSETIADTLTISDAVNLLVAFNVSIADQLTLNDNVTLLYDIENLPIYTFDALNLLDSLNICLEYKLLITDLLSLRDKIVVKRLPLVPEKEEIPASGYCVVWKVPNDSHIENVFPT